MRIAAAKGDGHKDPGHDRKGPAAGDDHPARAFAFAALEQHVRDDAVSQQNQHQGSGEFPEKWCSHRISSNPPNRTSVLQPSSTSEIIRFAQPLPYGVSRSAPPTNWRSTPQRP